MDGKDPKPKAIRIVPARTNDAEAIAAMGWDIWQCCYYPEVLSRDAMDYLWHRTGNRDRILEEMARGAVYEWIERAANRIGFLAYHLVPDQARMQLSKLYLLPQYHRRGIGARALTHVKTVAEQRGVREIHLYVFKKNRQAVRAYLRAGFIIAKAEISDAGNGYYYDDYMMTCCLDR
ncbi:MAG: N-acetyltransferase [Methylothermaceae bacterium]|nr:N-acetyltransferase [Methylothermaceae bacterium]